jgi:hypothetical protein
MVARVAGKLGARRATSKTVSKTELIFAAGHQLSIEL